jgi:hypothetical protein
MGGPVKIIICLLFIILLLPYNQSICRCYLTDSEQCLNSNLQSEFFENVDFGLHITHF